VITRTNTAHGSPCAILNVRVRWALLTPARQGQRLQRHVRGHDLHTFIFGIMRHHMRLELPHFIACIVTRQPIILRVTRDDVEIKTPVQLEPLGQRAEKLISNCPVHKRKNILLRPRHRPNPHLIDIAYHKRGLTHTTSDLICNPTHQPSHDYIHRPLWCSLGGEFDWARDCLCTPDKQSVDVELHALLCVVGACKMCPYALVGHREPIGRHDIVHFRIVPCSNPEGELALVGAEHEPKVPGAKCGVRVERRHIPAVLSNLHVSHPALDRNCIPNTVVVHQRTLCSHSNVALITLKLNVRLRLRQGHIHKFRQPLIILTLKRLAIHFQQPLLHLPLLQPTRSHNLGVRWRCPGHFRESSSMPQRRRERPSHLRNTCHGLQCMRARMRSRACGGRQWCMRGSGNRRCDDILECERAHTHPGTASPLLAVLCSGSVVPKP